MIEIKDNKTGKLLFGLSYHVKAKNNECHATLHLKNDSELRIIFDVPAEASMDFIENEVKERLRNIKILEIPSPPKARIIKEEGFSKYEGFVFLLVLILIILSLHC